MCFTKTDDGQRYYQIFGIFSPPRLIASDADHAALKRLCRTYSLTFAVGTFLLVPLMPFIPAFWAILSAWYYDKARRLSAKTDISRPPFGFQQMLRDRARGESIAAIGAQLGTWSLGTCIGASFLIFKSHDADFVLLGLLLITLSGCLVWAHAVMLVAKIRRVDSRPS